MQLPVLNEIAFPAVNGLESVHSDTKTSSKNALMFPVIGLNKILKSYVMLGSTVITSSVCKVIVLAVDL